MFQTTGPPQSWPTKMAFSRPKASIRPAMSPHRCRMSYASTDSGLSVAPFPLWFGADGPISGLCQRGHLESPGVGELRKSVRQKHRGPLSQLVHFHVDLTGAIGPRVRECDRHLLSSPM